ncbi:hypothetical protein D3C77_523570 [compost metagenome]
MTSSVEIALPCVAVIIVVPALRGVKNPFSTLIMLASLDFHVIFPVTSLFTVEPSTVAHTFNCFVVFPTVNSSVEEEPSMSIDRTSPVAAKTPDGKTMLSSKAVTRTHLLINFLCTRISFSPFKSNFPYFRICILFLYRQLGVIT